MQVKKFEAPTIQEALDTIKRELGPEAIILQTKKNRRGFGLLSKPSVEVTAAVSDRSITKKQYVETRLAEPKKAELNKMPANRQADVLDKYGDRYLEKRTRGGASAAGPAKPAPQKKITATRYIDIQDGGEAAAPARQTASPGPQKPLPASHDNAAQALAQGSADRVVARSSMEDELRQLKKMIQEMKTAQEDAPVAGAAQAFGSQAMQEAFEQLIINGMDKRFALALMRRVGQSVGADGTNNGDAVADQIALELMESTEVLSPLSGVEAANPEKGPAVIAVVGPTGVGKTTTVAKMASEALLKRNLKVGLINLDTYKVAALDQLGTYGKILNVPFRSASNADELKAALDDFHSLDLVLIDTTGRSQKDPGSLRAMQTLLATAPGVRTQLVLSVTTRDTELYDMANRFAVFRPEGIIMSKLDEATIYGAIYNVSQKVKLPLLYFTTGQRVPEDIEEASRERVAALLMNI